MLREYTHPRARHSSFAEGRRTTQSLLCNISARLWFSRIKGIRSLSTVSSMFGIDFAMSSSEKGMLQREKWNKQRWKRSIGCCSKGAQTMESLGAWCVPGIIIQQDWKAGEAIWFFMHGCSHAWCELQTARKQRRNQHFKQFWLHRFSLSTYLCWKYVCAAHVVPVHTNYSL